MTVLVTGGAGFIGAWVARRLLAAGHAVRVFDRDPGRAMLDSVLGGAAQAIELRQGDVADEAAVISAAEGCDAVVHLAAMLTSACAADPVRGATVDVGGTLAVFGAARRHGIRRVAYASSAASYGPDGTSLDPHTEYGAFKLATENLARILWRDHGIASVGLRPLVVYGPGREEGVTAGLSIACAKARAGQPYTIPFTGRTDAIFVDDVAAAFVAAVTRPVTGAHALNLHGEVVDVADVVAALRALHPGAVLDASGPPLPFAPERPDTGNEAVLGPLPRTGLRAGLARTAAFLPGSAGPGNGT